MKTFFIACDQILFLILNKYHHPFMDQFFRLITNMRFLSLCYVILQLFFIKVRIGWRGAILFSITMAASELIAGSLLKPLLARCRPCNTVDMIPWVHLIGPCKDTYSCPSTHASNTFAFAMLFWQFFKDRYKWSYLFFILATIISYGRVYGGVHYPLDIIFGAMVGSCIGLAMYYLYQRYMQVDAKAKENETKLSLIDDKT